MCQGQKLSKWKFMCMRSIKGKGYFTVAKKNCEVTGKTWAMVC